MGITVSFISSNMVSEVQTLADLTVGKGLVTQNEIISAVDNNLSYVLIMNDDKTVIGFSLNEIINPKILKSLFCMCDETYGDISISDDCTANIVNLGALGIMPQYQQRGYGRLLFQTIVNGFQQQYDFISALAWKKGEIIPMRKLLEQAGFIYLGLMKSPYRDVQGIYCDYCKSDVCLCDSCLFTWAR